MKRLVPLAAFALALVAPLSPLEASGDYGCEPAWKLASDGLSDCGNRAVLSPGNDTRVNMFFLLLDRRGAAGTGATSPASWGEEGLGRNFFYWDTLRKAYDPSYDGVGDSAPFYGSRCFSLAAGGQAFAEAMRANRGLPGAERDRLTATRELLVKRCSAEAAPGASWPADVKSAPGREFLGYLRGADAFYGGDWAVAREAFQGLRGARDPWIAETALYMTARTELNAAQAASFDEYGDFAGAEKSDRAALARARAGFDAYLKRHADGRYAASAIGLARRVLWLEGDVAALSREYERMLGQLAPTGRRAGDLIQEIDNKLLMAEGSRSAVGGPLLLATLDLMAMRDADDSGVPVITAEALAAQEPRFAGHPDLFSFVTANHAYYVAANMRRVLALIPDDARRSSHSPLSFSRQVLRGMALAALKDRNEAGFWRELLGGATAPYQRPVVELALAMNYERNGKLADVFAAGSPIVEAPIREILLHHVAGPDLLRAQAGDRTRSGHERDLALFTLLYKQLTRGDYAGYLRDSAMLRADATSQGGFWGLPGQAEIPLGLFRGETRSEDYACPALRATVGALARNAADGKARLCLAEFFRLNGFDGFEAGYVAPAADELGGTPDRFPGKRAYRGKLYADVIADPRAGPEDKAYGLFRAVQCYAPSGNNECGAPDVPESRRKAWFQQLKRDYPNSEWAGQLRYYW